MVMPDIVFAIVHPGQCYSPVDVQLLKCEHLIFFLKNLTLIIKLLQFAKISNKPPWTTCYW